MTWKFVVGYEKKYEVSDTGKIRSCDVYVKNRNGYALKRGKFISPKLCKNGYLQVNLWRNNCGKMFLVHRLVALAFLDNPRNLNVINHLDECKTNNNVKNLAWCTASENVNYGTRNARSVESWKKTIRSKAL